MSVYKITKSFISLPTIYDVIINKTIPDVKTSSYLSVNALSMNIKIFYTPTVFYLALSESIF